MFINILHQPGSFLFGLSLQLVVGHGDDGKDKIDKVETSEENVENEE